MLAALAVAIPERNGNLTCIRVRANHGDAAGEAGDVWLDDASNRLLASEVPRATPIEVEPTARRIQFEFSSPNHPNVRAGLIDYAGELLNSTTQKDPTQIASVLLKYMRELDGLLVLVEAPKSSGMTNEAVQEIRRLAEAFAEVKPARPMPIALVITKWDRRAEVTTTTSAAETQRLVELLESDEVPALNQLRNVLRNVAGAENFQEFPVSAFGGFREVHGFETPPSGPLRSFGLVAPFVWTSTRRAELDLQNYAEIVEKTVWWKILDLSTLRPFRIPLAQAFHQGSVENSKFNQLRRRRRWSLAGRVSVYSLLLLSITLFAETGLDRWEIHAFQQVAKSPTSSDEQLVKAIEWLGHYALPSPVRHRLSYWLVLSKAEASRRVQVLEEKRESDAWNLAVETDEPAVRAENTRLYIQRFPNGPHNTDGRKIIADYEIAIKREENEKRLTEIGAAIDSTHINDEAAIRRVLDMIRQGLPHTEIADTRQKGKHRDYDEKVSSKLRDVVERQDWEKFLPQYESDFNSGRFLEAARWLENRRKSKDEPKSRDEQLGRLLTEFQNDVSKAMEAQVNRLIKSRKWDEASKQLKDYDRWPLSMQTEPIGQAIRRIKKNVEASEDEQLYRAFVEAKDDLTADAYLKNTRGPKTMAREVEAYRSYLMSLEQPKDLSLSLEKIEWAEGCWNNSYNHILVHVDQVKQIDHVGVLSKYNTIKEIKDIAYFKKKVGDSITIRMSIINEDYFFGGGSHKHGEGTITILLRPSSSNFSLDLPFDSNSPNKAVFRLTGLPKEPETPTWRKEE